MGIDRLRQSYGVFFQDPEGFDKVLDPLKARFKQDYVDLGALGDDLQYYVLNKLNKDPGYEKELQTLNPFLGAFFKNPPSESEALLRKNIVQSSYSPEIYKNLLMKIYRSVGAGGSLGKINKKSLIESFLIPESFFLGAS